MNAAFHRFGVKFGLFLVAWREVKVFELNCVFTRQAPAWEMHAYERCTPGRCMPGRCMPGRCTPGDACLGDAHPGDAHLTDARLWEMHAYGDACLSPALPTLCTSSA
jgi:hypothetical protein